MAYSPFFYGYYSGTFGFEIGRFTFDFPLSYFLVMQGVFLVNLVAVVYSSAKSFTADLQLVDTARTRFNGLVFGGWDHKVQCNICLGVENWHYFTPVVPLRSPKGEKRSVLAI